MKYLSIFMGLFISCSVWAQSNQVILSHLPTTLHEYSIYDYGAKCDGSTNDSAAINLAEAKAAAAGGGYVTGYGTCAISSALVYHDPRVVFLAKNYGDGAHTVGNFDNGWSLKWTGAGGATMLTISATAGAGNQALFGNGIHGVTFDCNSLAAIAVQLGSVQGSEFHGMMFLECTTAAIDLVPVSTLGDTTSVQKDSFFGTSCRIVSNTGICARLRGNGAGTANTSFVSFYDTNIVYKNGEGIQLLDTDNVRFFGTQMTRAAAGTAIGVEVSGDAGGGFSRSDFFYDLSPGAGGVTIRGTETNPVAAQNIQIIGYDITNSAPTIVTGTGVTGVTVYKENGHILGGGMANASFGGNDSELSSAITACPATASVCLYNGSTDGFRFYDGTGSWLIRQDGSHNLQFVRQAGTGGILMSSTITMGASTGIILPVTTVGSLPGCGAGQKGEIYAVSDATAPTYNAALTGGGAVSVPVYCNGSAWTSH